MVEVVWEVSIIFRFLQNNPGLSLIENVVENMKIFCDVTVRSPRHLASFPEVDDYAFPVATEPVLRLPRQQIRRREKGMVSKCFPVAEAPLNIVNIP